MGEAEQIFSQTYLYTYLLILIASLFFFSFGVFFYPYTTPISTPEISIEDKTIFQVGIQIFANNLLPFFVTIIPVLGAIYFFYQAYMVGAFLKVFALANNLSLQVAFQSSLTNPILYLEFSAFSLASASMIMIFLDRNWTVLSKRLAFSLAVLFISAFAEAFLIMM